MYMNFLIFSILSHVATKDRGFGCKFNSFMAKRFSDNVTKILATQSENICYTSTTSLFDLRLAANRLWHGNKHILKFDVSAVTVLSHIIAFRKQNATWFIKTSLF